jgi:molybdopterin/thiamine biosynthesis adenylyltransferase
MCWWETKKHILVREKRKIDEAFPDNNFSFKVIDNSLWISGNLLELFEFDCRYPPSYPSAPPDIFPKDRSSKHVPGHQYVKEGRFCLDIREKTWSSRLTAADIIKSLETLLAAQWIKRYKKLDKLPVYEEPEPTSLDHIIRFKQCIFPTDIAYPTQNKCGLFKYVYKFNYDTYRIIVTELVDNEIESKSKIVAEIWLEESIRTELDGIWLRVEREKLFDLLLNPDKEKVYEDIISLLKEDHDTYDHFKTKKIRNLIVFDDESPGLNYLLTLNTKKGVFDRYGIYRFTVEKLQDRLPSKDIFKHLKDKKVTIVGCGSGGSIDSEYLVKSGVGNLVLIDDDLLETENILRHSCRIDSLSFEKIYAVKENLKKINPDVNIDVKRLKIDVIGQDVDKLINNSDLIIVATAESEELFNEYAYTHGIPAIYSKVYPMGFGGEVIRVIPGATPCYECMHFYKEALLQENYPDTQFPEIETASYDTLQDGTHIPTPALAIDSDFISLIEVKMALEVLLADNAASLVEVPNIRLWGNQKEWIFKNEFECLSLSTKDFKSIYNCIVCHGEKVVEQELGLSTDQVESKYEQIITSINKVNDVE